MESNNNQNHTNLWDHSRREINSKIRLNRSKTSFSVYSKLKKNAFSLSLLSIAIGSIFYYSIWKVSQDDFSDVDSKGNVRTKL